MTAFDKLCWMAERHEDVLGSNLLRLLRQAALFSFPYVAHEVLPKSYTAEEIAFQREFFVLPFSVTAIEDKTSCVLLWDESASSGLAVRRFFVEFASLASMHRSTASNGEQANALWKNYEEEMQARKELGPDLMRVLDESYQLSFGEITVADSVQYRYELRGDVFQFVILNDQGVSPLGQLIWNENQQRISEGCLRNAMTAIEELMVFNRPDRFIVRETPARLREANSIKIPRTHERHVYTLLHPTEIRTRLNLPRPQDADATGKAAPRFVGERRRHVRRYPDDPSRWPNMHGKSIIIPATWVGPSESVVGRRTYKIMLDL